MEAANFTLTESGFIKWEYEDPQQFEAFSFEKFDGNEQRRWTKNNYSTILIICAIYFIFIKLGPKCMKNREAYKLDKPLAAWNFFLALFSLGVFVRMTPEHIRSIQQHDGFYKYFCVVPEVYNYQSTFWMFLYALSKVVELGDTVFIVLRKKPLKLLHWFHHLTMLWASFFLFVEGEPSVKHITYFNAFVHILMYSYFGLRALKVKIPQKIAMTITILQITQFVWGLGVQFVQLFYYGGKDRSCYRTRNSIIVTHILGFSYLFLFARMFYTSYISKEKRKTE